MFEPLLADGLLSGAADKVAEFALKCLAVAGAFLVGYFLGGVIAWALDRWVFARKSPEALKKTCAIVAGVVLAILVALIVFGEGGSGLFGRGGSQGDGKGTPSTDDKGKASQPVVDPKKEIPPPKKDDPIKIDPKSIEATIRVAIRAGDEVREGRFYLADDNPNPMTFAELKDTVNARRKAIKGEILIVFRFQGEALSTTHPAVRQAVEWVTSEKILNRFE